MVDAVEMEIRLELIGMMWDMILEQHRSTLRLLNEEQRNDSYNIVVSATLLWSKLRAKYV